MFHVVIFSQLNTCIATSTILNAFQLSSLTYSAPISDFTDVLSGSQLSSKNPSKSDIIYEEVQDFACVEAKGGVGG